ncbi:MAG: S9 family peptidase [Spirosomataceae bacterium]
MQKLLLLSLISLVCSSLFAQPKNWTPQEMVKLKRVSNSVISPDGRLVAYVVATPLMDGEKSEFLSQIWVADTQTKTNRQFTFGDKSCTNPKFSPDGTQLSFVSSRGKDGKPQLYVLSLLGGEAEQVSNSKTGVSAYEWAPDSKRIAFLMTDPLTDKEEKDRKEKRDMVVYDVFKYNHLYTLSLQKNAKGEHPAKRLTAGNYQVTDFAWSPDSKTIAFVQQQNPTANVGSTRDIASIPADSGAVKVLVTNQGSDAQPSYSPDGKWLAYVSSGANTKWSGSTHVYIMPANGGTPQRLAKTFDQQPSIVRWTADNKALYITEARKTASGLYTLPISGGEPQQVSLREGVYGNVSINEKGQAAFVYQNPSTPPDVYVAPINGFPTIEKLSAVNPELANKPVAKTEVVSWKSKDGKFTVEGLLTYPTNYEKGKKYPLILNIHGGPAGVFSQGYIGAGAVYPLQAFAQQGYFVLRPNPRGSIGYGEEFRLANYDDWGYNDYEDLMAGVDKTIEQGMVHPDSLCVTGWSYGGFMTSMIITKTNRFKAAMVGAGVTNLMSMNGTTDIPGLIIDSFGGDFWDRMESYEKHSAMFNIKNAKTPTQIIHGEADDRVPISQGRELYVALKRLGVKTEMIAYPRTPHGPQEPKFIEDIGQRIIQWFNSNMRQPKSAASAVSGGEK